MHTHRVVTIILGVSSAGGAVDPHPHFFVFIFLKNVSAFLRVGLKCLCTRIFV